MTQEEIINGSKLIAEYLGWIYIPFSADLQGHKKAGWYQVKSAKPNIQKAKLRSKNTSTGEETVEELEIDVNFIKFICRKHSDLRFWNSLDALIPVIQKIEKKSEATVCLYNNGCKIGWGIYLDDLIEEVSSFDLPNWSNNTFKVIVKYLETK